MAAVILPHHGVWPTIDETAWIAPTAAVIGDVVIGPGSGIWFGCTVRGDVNEIRIGARANIQDGTVIHVTTGGHGTYIGDDVTVGHCALLHACTVESGAFIGMQACLMDGVVVESGGMVAAGALVTPGKRVAAGQLWAGSPAKHIRDVNEQEAGFMPVSAERYAGLARDYLAIMAEQKG
jgi:carbonic anhydrase/acetyltransferase-like protein (isoleucine patch superfamily)